MAGRLKGGITVVISNHYNKKSGNKNNYRTLYVQSDATDLKGVGQIEPVQSFP